MKSYLSNCLSIIALFAILTLPLVHAQQAVAGEGVLDRALAEAKARVTKATAELATLRRTIEEEKIPSNQRITALEEKLIDVRKEYDRVLKLRDSSTLDVSNLTARITALQAQEKYLNGLVDDYVRNLEARLHVAESQRYGESVVGLKTKSENANLSERERIGARLDLISLSLDRLEDAVGGSVFEGSAADASGVIREGKFLQVGPLVWFAAADGSAAGLSDSRLGSAEPTIIPVPDLEPGLLATAVANGGGLLPVDVTRGQAIKVAEMNDSIVEEFLKGGSVMWPMGILAVLALIVALLKWIHLSLVQRPSQRRLARIFEHLGATRVQAARKEAVQVRGPVGRMLAAAIDHFNEPQDLVEEAMYEQTLKAKTSLNSWLPFIGITAAASPLLGLLGTVTGMISTFKLITIFGTGDAGNFSAGISEALITTKWGLVMAIPALLIHAYLSRKAKAVLDDMEKIAIAYMGHINTDGSHVSSAKPNAGNPPQNDSGAQVSPALA